ncbi:hypothetical protein H2203_007883 [Taxawa tesnikishii (nom. ined.)]|nr:hypothetical protein H2203_007883 [Dothideales sp. JES 119]
MGKPRMIILIRHAQSEGNKNREIHQMIPDHRVKLTAEGQQQAEEAGRRLRSMLRPDDTLQFFTSPYRRTRETTEGILKSLTSPSREGAPSPFPRHTIKVFEEPRIREQDFGNFQPCSTEMERMWQERADYGHFFYRIPNGESAADAYDRISGFNESLWRNFNEEDFPSVCVLVTHGLMTRVFLMKWYHWSVEYFEDLRNVNHCEFVVMKRSTDSGKYVLENQLRTWSELKRRAMSTQNISSSAQQQSPAIPPVRRWGGCIGGCNHDHSAYPRRQKRADTQEVVLPPPAVEIPNDEKEDHAVAMQEIDASRKDGVAAPVAAQSTSSASTSNLPNPSGSGHHGTTTDSPSSGDENTKLPIRSALPHLSFGRDFGGSLSGAATPAEGLSDADEDAHRDYFDGNARLPQLKAKAKRRTPRRKPTDQDIENWARQSGMGTGEEEEEEEEEEEDEPGAEVAGREVKKLEKMESEDRSIRGSVY